MKIGNILNKLEHPDEKYEAFFDLELKYRIKIIMAYVIITLLPVIIGVLYFWDARGKPIFNGAMIVSAFFYFMQVGEVIAFLNKKSRNLYKQYFLWIMGLSVILGMLFGFFGFDYFEAFGVSIAEYLNNDKPFSSIGYEATGLLLIFTTFILGQYGAGLITRASRRLYTQKAGMQADLRFAREVQESILQDVSIECGQSQAYGCSYPANELGGDFFELKQENKHIFAAVGDVSGHSFGAGLLMTMLKSAYYTHLEYLDSPSQIMAKLNELMVNQSKRGMFATMVILQIDTVEKRATLCNAGHLPVLHYNSNTAELQQRHQKGIGLGMTEGTTYKDLTFDVASGDLLFLYSDGLTEIRDKNNQVRDPAFFEQIVKKHASGAHANAHKSLKKQTGEIIDAVNTLHNRHRLEDDATLLAIRI